MNPTNRQPGAGAGESADWLLEAALAPDTDDELAPLYHGCAEGVLVLPFCASCGLPLELEQRVCDGCATPDPVWHAVEPIGTVHTATVVHRIEPGLVCADDPYPVADIELTSGHRMIMTSVCAATEPPAISTTVGIGFRRVGGVAVPGFTQEASPAEHTPEQAPSERSR